VWNVTHAPPAHHKLPTRLKRCAFVVKSSRRVVNLTRYSRVASAGQPYPRAPQTRRASHSVITLSNKFLVRFTYDYQPTITNRNNLSLPIARRFAGQQSPHLTTHSNYKISYRKTAQLTTTADVVL
jgi:hypothetical protein